LKDLNVLIPYNLNYFLWPWKYIYIDIFKFINKNFFLFEVFLKSRCVC